MGISEFQEFLETQCKDACVSVDLLQIARSFATSHMRHGTQGLDEHSAFGLVVDAESCLDRLYGGYFSDWVCGGQWNKMTQFLANLVDACERSSVRLAVVFNGAIESDHMMQQWFSEQLQYKKNANLVLKHVNNRGTPPPKIWWNPPVALHWCLRMALRSLRVTVHCTTDDHHQEVIGFCRENSFNGILAHSAEYAIFDPPRYFSSHNMKLTFKGSLETKEYIMDQVAKCLNLHPDRFCLLAALLGNHILSEADLQEFFKEVLAVPAEQKGYKVDTQQLIQEVVSFVRSLPSPDNLDSVGEVVFRKCNEKEDKISRFKQSVQYYLNGTHEGFLKYRPKNKRAYTTAKQSGGGYPAAARLATVTAAKEEESSIPPDDGTSSDQDSEQKDSQPSSVYTEGDSGYSQESVTAVPAPEIKIENEPQQDLTEMMEDMTIKEEKPKLNGEPEPDIKPQPNRLDATLISSSSSSSDGSSPSRLSPDPSYIVSIHQVESKTVPQATKAKPAAEKISTKSLPSITPEIMRIASERHQKGLMIPWVYQVLSQGEIKFSVTLEDDQALEFPHSNVLFRPIRIQCYSMLYNLNRKKRDQETAILEKKASGPFESLEVTVKEWMIFSAQDKVPHGVPVLVKPLLWNVPTIESLWLGQKPEYKSFRLTAFLSCMKSETPLMLNTSYVPQHLLLMCCVLRYIIQYERPVFRRCELDAVLAQSVSPVLQDVQTMQDMKLPMIHTRGIQLAAIFMRGVETAIFVNEVCGAPIPWNMCCPWMYFDGKLFHYKLLKASNNAMLLDMCDGQVDQVMKVERMRQAILEGLPYDCINFTKSLLPVMQHTPYNPYAPSYHMSNARPAGFMPPQGRGKKGHAGRGLLGDYEYGHHVDARGASLQIAGQVVSSWGPTHSPIQPRGRGMHVVGAPIYAYGPHGGGNRGRGGMRGVNSNRNRYVPRGKSGRKVPLKDTQLAGADTGSGRGRGCTFENPADGTNVSVKDLIKSEEDTEEPEEPEDIKIKQELFLDAESGGCGDQPHPVTGTPETVKPAKEAEEPVMSPDSGIGTVE